jgi:phosphatidylserine/phosphatidylglycerophosphate/cardiolipin synthase-like enzyme
VHDAPTTSPLGPELERELDRRTGTAARAGNAVDFLPSGHQSYALRWALLEGARRSIHVVAFSMMRDGTSRRLRDLLLGKLRQGVAVRLILDDAVLFSTFAGGYLRALRRAGAEVVRYHHVFRGLGPVPGEGGPIDRSARMLKLKMKRRFHEKYLVVDGREAVLGGINWGDKYAYGGLRPKAWRDSDVHVRGPVVADIQRQFVRDLFLYPAMEPLGRAAAVVHLGDPALSAAVARADAFAAAQAESCFPPLEAEGPERVRYVAHKPYDEQRLPLTEAYLTIFRAARRSIWWGCHGIRPPRIVAETLADAVRRGVEVRLITNSRRSSRTLMFFGLLGWMYRESRNHFPWLLRNGMRIYEWQLPGAFHSKNLVVDGELASVGSYNVARGSTYHHTESNLIFQGGALPGLVHAQFERDLESCRELRPEEVPAAPPRFDPFLRLLHERDLLVPPELRTPAVAADLAAGRYKRM